MPILLVSQTSFRPELQEYLTNFDNLNGHQKPQEDLSNGTKNVSRQSVFTKLLVDQPAITKLLDTKSLISQEPLDIIIHFNDHCEALFNALLLAINRPQGNNIPWRYKVLNVCT